MSSSVGDSRSDGRAVAAGLECDTPRPGEYTVADGSESASLPAPPKPALAAVPDAPDTATTQHQPPVVLQPRGSDIFRVFVSFSAKNNRDGDVSAFVKDLEKLFRYLSGFEEGEYAFYLSDDQGRQGTDWHRELDWELNRADVLIPVMSPDFFRSEWCAREWGAFEERLGVIPDVDPPERIVPVVWFKEELPPAARGLRVGWGPTQVPDYREVGLSLLREEDPRQYRTAVRLLAAQLKALVEDGGSLPVLDPPVDVGTAALAFPPRRATTPCAAWHYYLVHASVSADGLTALETAGDDAAAVSPAPAQREPRYYYGRSSEQWDPFRPNGDVRLESRIRRTIEDEAWSHRMRPVKTGQSVLDFTYGIPPEISEVRDGMRAIVIVPMDAWLLQFSAWHTYTLALATLAGARVVLLAPKAPDPQFRHLWKTRLDGTLRSAVNGGGGDTTTFHGEPDDPDGLVRDLRELLPKACSGRSPTWRRPGGPPSLPTRRGG